MIVKTRKFNNRYLAKVIREATRFYLGRLLPETKFKKLNIIVKQTDSDYADGSCYYKSKYEYEIELGAHVSVNHKLLTLAHECVHVKQYTTRQLKTFYVGHYPVDMWEGKRYRNLKYDDQPWEREALESEEELLYSFISECYALGNLDLEKLKS